MKFADMYAWWNQAALENPMTAILSNHANWDRHQFFETGKTWLAEHKAFAAGAGVTLGGASALDFCCGMGRMSEARQEVFRWLRSALFAAAYRGHDGPQSVAGDAAILPCRGIEVEPCAL